MGRGEARVDLMITGRIKGSPLIAVFAGATHELTAPRWLLKDFGDALMSLPEPKKGRTAVCSCCLWSRT